MRASRPLSRPDGCPGEVTQLGLGALTTYPLENGGQKGEEKRARVVTLEEASAINIYKHKSPIFCATLPLCPSTEERPKKNTFFEVSNLTKYKSVKLRNLI